MEIALASSVVGLGYYLSDKNQKTTPDKPTHPIRSLQPRPEMTRSIDTNTHTATVGRGSRLKPSQTIANPRQPQQSTPIQYLQRPTYTRGNNQRGNNVDFLKFTVDGQVDSTTPFKPATTTGFSSLSGQQLNSSEFTHNNMVPFFGGSIKQNVDTTANQSLLEKHTGVPVHSQKKEETRPMFEPTKNMGNVFGTQNNIDNQLNRYIASDKRTNETPIERVTVGPGLNKGFTWKPSGGVHQSDTREYVMPKNVDQLRAVNNPKVTYEGRVVAGKSMIGKRTNMGVVERRAPNRFYLNDPKRYNTTVGAYTKEAVRPKTVARDTSRQVSRQVIGAAGPASNKREVNRPEVKPSGKVVYQQQGVRNVGAPGQWTNVNVGDYGKKGHNNPTNKRTAISEKTHSTNLTSIVKAIVAPIQDIFRSTRKETTIKENLVGNLDGLTKKPMVYDPNDIARRTIKETNIHNDRTGNMAIQGPTRTTIYDNTQVARTTIKETNVHDTRTGNMNGPMRLTVYDPNDIARRTVKETNIHNSTTGAIAVSAKVPVFDPNDIARRTIKETNIHDSRDGNMEARDRGFVYDPSDVARRTVKETNIHDTRDGNLETRDRGFVYDPSDVARRTVKETNIHDTRDGDLAVSATVPVYDPSDVARRTVKETNIHDTREGNMEARGRGFVYDPTDVARRTVKETNIHDNRDGNLEARDRGFVYDPSDVARRTVKETNIHDTRDGDLAVSAKVPVYDPNDVARRTVKETNIHDNREGNMEARGRGVVYDPNDVARRTVKETNIHDTRDGNLGARDGGFVYDPDNVAKPTVRQTMDPEDDQANVTGIAKHQVQDPDDVALTTIRETTEGNEHHGHISSTQQGDAYLVDDCDVRETHRQFTSDHEYSGHADGQVGTGNGAGYLSANPEVGETHRQFTSDNNYHGTVRGNTAAISYEDVYNATLNELREGTLQGRAPTRSAGKVASGKEAVHMEIQKQEGDYINNRDTNLTRVSSQIPEARHQGEIANPNQLDNDALADRNNPEMLKAFHSNPLTKPLNVA